MGIQSLNLIDLPENYNMKFYLYHFVRWPQLSFVAENNEGKLVGYVVGKMDDEEPSGHIVSLSVMRTYRRLGLAQIMMKQTTAQMKQVFGAEHVSLHVRKTNRAAYGLYKDSLKFKVDTIEKKYYADGEDAYVMKLLLD
ncbi:hypothetical protein INT47_002476 [Mucor saturninus]|uniref:N-acetyltransferase domain-containing protein n=1 Tax=Mucor saturninus TaxID=64648 RepID=A0A8H7VDJ0_9FUNG|nr:hypothetical protein INT47_002476 [Mucor saturninus]